MKELDIATVLGILQAMLGAPLLYSLLLLTLLGLLAFVTVLLRERRVSACRLLLCQLLGTVGGLLGIWVMTAALSSGFVMLGGSADWLLFALIFGLGWAIATFSFYGVLGWLRPRTCATA